MNSHCFDSRKRRFNVSLFLCFALLGWIVFVPGNNPGVPTAEAHTRLGGADPSFPSPAYYSNDDYILDALSVAANGFGDDPGSTGSGSTPSLVSANAHGYANAALIRQLLRKPKEHKNVPIHFTVRGQAYAFARGGAFGWFDWDEPKSGVLKIYKKPCNTWARIDSFGVSANISRSDPHGGSHYAYYWHELSVDNCEKVSNRATHRSGKSP